MKNVIPLSKYVSYIKAMISFMIVSKLKFYLMKIKLNIQLVSAHIYF